MVRGGDINIKMDFLYFYEKLNNYQLVACGRRKKRRSFIEDGSNDLAYDISPDMVEDDLMSSAKDPGQVTGGMRYFPLT